MTASKRTKAFHRAEWKHDDQLQRLTEAVATQHASAGMMEKVQHDKSEQYCDFGFKNLHCLARTSGARYSLRACASCCLRNDDELSTITDATDADSDSTYPPKQRSRKR